MLVTIVPGIKIYLPTRELGGGYTLDLVPLGTSHAINTNALAEIHRETSRLTKNCEVLLDEPHRVDTVANRQCRIRHFVVNPLPSHPAEELHVEFDATMSEQRTVGRDSHHAIGRLIFPFVRG